MIYLHLHKARQELSQDSPAAGLVDILYLISSPRLCWLHREQLLKSWSLGHGGDKLGISQIDHVNESIRIVINDDSRDGEGIEKGGAVRDSNEFSPHFSPISPHKVPPPPTHSDKHRGGNLPQDEAGCAAVHISVKPTAQAAVSSDMDYLHPAHLSSLQ